MSYKYQKHIHSSGIPRYIGFLYVSRLKNLQDRSQGSECDFFYKYSARELRRHWVSELVLLRSYTNQKMSVNYIYCGVKLKNRYQWSTGAVLNKLYLINYYPSNIIFSVFHRMVTTKPLIYRSTISNYKIECYNDHKKSLKRVL